MTAARNSWTLDTSTELPAIGAVTGGGGTVALVSSILVDTRGYTGSIFSDCLIVDDASGLIPSNTVLVGIDPRLMDPDSGDLRLQGGSPAIDYCDTFYFTPEDPLDLNLDARGVDHPEIAGSFGTYDIGVDETLESAALFVDGFEIGDTTAWD